MTCANELKVTSEGHYCGPRSEEIEQLKVKRKRLQEDIEGLEAESAAKSDKAEQLNVMPLCVQANALRRRAAEKKEEVASLDRQLAEKSQALKQ